jgi:hypothetical protein
MCSLFRSLDHLWIYFLDFHSVPLSCMFVLLGTYWFNHCTSWGSIVINFFSFSWLFLLFEIFGISYKFYFFPKKVLLAFYPRVHSFLCLTWFCLLFCDKRFYQLTSAKKSYHQVEKKCLSNMQKKGTHILLVGLHD